MRENSFSHFLKPIFSNAANTMIKCFIDWHNNPRRKFIMGARLSWSKSQSVSPLELARTTPSAFQKPVRLAGG